MWRYFHLLPILMLLNYSNSLAEAADITPKIPPGYQPIDAQTERGLWMELEEYETAIKQSALLVKDKQINDYVKSTACKVAGDYCDDLRVYIIRNPGFNASMTANGIMQVWTGLLVRVSDEHELAAVLGHELAHYTQLHTLERLRQINEKMASGSIIDLGIMLVTGVAIPVGQMSAIASVMAFSRDQEEEADLLGVKFMAQSGYNPNAAAQVWEMIVEEEEEAVAKSREPGMFSKTHPSSTDRIVNLKSFVSETNSEIKGIKENRNRHTDILDQYYMMLMEDQLDTNRFGRTQNILRTHMEIGVKPGLIYFFQGEMYRQRKREGDLGLAKKSYKLAINSDEPVADAYRNLGYIELKQGNSSQAVDLFSHYLELKPDADDRAMIEFYLQE
jgi:predicted Zn-dependent protease